MLVINILLCLDLLVMLNLVLRVLSWLILVCYYKKLEASDYPSHETLVRSSALLLLDAFWN